MVTATENQGCLLHSHGDCAGFNDGHAGFRVVLPRNNVFQRLRQFSCIGSVLGLNQIQVAVSIAGSVVRDQGIGFQFCAEFGGITSWQVKLGDFGGGAGDFFGIGLESSVHATSGEQNNQDNGKNRFGIHFEPYFYPFE